MSKIKDLIEILSMKTIGCQAKNHKLREACGYWNACRKPDWLLVYKKDGKHIYLLELVALHLF